MSSFFVNSFLRVDECQPRIHCDLIKTVIFNKSSWSNSLTTWMQFNEVPKPWSNPQFALKRNECGDHQDGRTNDLRYHLFIQLHEGETIMDSVVNCSFCNKIYIPCYWFLIPMYLFFFFSVVIVHNDLTILRAHAQICFQKSETLITSMRCILISGSQYLNSAYSYWLTRKSRAFCDCNKIWC